MAPSAMCVEALFCKVRDLGMQKGDDIIYFVGIWGCRKEMAQQARSIR
jgi:hypothetical protein